MKKLQYLATAMAYMVSADGEKAVEEKAKMLSILGKHVARKDLSSLELQNMVQTAFSEAAQKPLDEFLETIVSELSNGQQAAMLLTLYDLIAVDGYIVEKERKVIVEFEKRLNVDYTASRVAREVLIYKNNTSIFVSEAHPHNEPDFIWSPLISSELTKIVK